MNYPFQYCFPNGLKVVLQETPFLQTTSIAYFVRVGSRYEKNVSLGISHFIEHMLFKGSEHYSFQQISEGIEGKGGVFNAYTTDETTVYYCKIFPHDLNLALKLLLDMLRFPKFCELDVEKERHVILEEINAASDQPSELIEDLFSQLIWGDHPLGSSILGNEKSIHKITKEELIAFHKQYYTASNITLSIAGPIQLKKVFESIKETFCKGGSSAYLPFVKPQNKPRIKVYKKNLEQCYLQLGFPVCDRYSLEQWPLKLIVSLLGDQMCSRLYREIRENQALAYFISSEEQLYEDVGAFCIRCDVDKDNVLVCIEKCLELIYELKKTLVSEEELNQARWVAKGELIHSMESSLDFVFWNGEHFQAGEKIISIQEYYDKLDKVTPFDIQSFAKKYFNMECLNCLCLGDFEGVEEINAMVYNCS
jgi:predicted Zn-dependent peptidase